MYTYTVDIGLNIHTYMHTSIYQKCVCESWVFKNPLDCLCIYRGMHVAVTCTHTQTHRHAYAGKAKAPLWAAWHWAIFLMEFLRPTK